MTHTQAAAGIVVGAGPGMGAALARRCAADGLTAFLVSRSADTTAPLAESITAGGGQAQTVVADAADPAAVTAAVAGIAARMPVKVLAYNAAAFGGPLLTVTDDQLTAALCVSVVSAVAAVRAAAGNLAANNGAVLLTGGGLALHPTAAAGVLSLGKAALRAAALLLAEELAPRDVPVRILTITGTIGSSPELSPDLLASLLWQLTDGDEVERVYPGAS